MCKFILFLRTAFKLKHKALYRYGNNAIDGLRYSYLWVFEKKMGIMFAAIIEDRVN